MQTFSVANFSIIHISAHLQLVGNVLLHFKNCYHVIQQPVAFVLWTLCNRVLELTKS